MQALLKKYWGYDSFRSVQREAIDSAMGGRDTLVLMPTGGGKSLLYQLPGIAQAGICIVVTPLIALMKDQVDKLSRRGIRAIAIHSGLSQRQIDIALDNCVYGDVKFLYVSPERIATELFRMRAGRMNVNLIAVDEAHCISQWGYDFRPAYLKIAQLRTIVPHAPMIALTASATEEVVEDICARLELRSPAIIRAGFERPNLAYAVRRAEDKPEQLLRILAGVPGQGIVYVRTREAAGQVAELLRERGVEADYYHGGLGAAERAARQDDWMAGRRRIVVATNAFGMGIDKADVRAVVHWDTPDSLEAYYQEAGRAGRDGARAYAVLLLSPDDAARAARRLASEFPSIEMIRACYEAIFNYLQIGIGDGRYASFEFNLFDFASRTRLHSASVRNAIDILAQNGYLQLTDPTDLPPRIMFSVSRDDLYKIRIEREELDHILRVILRLYNGVFHGFVAIDQAEIASVSGYTVERVKELLSRLWNLRVIRYVPGGNAPLLILLEERLPTADVRISPESYEYRKRAATKRSEAIFAYAEEPLECRSVLLSRYFGQRDAAPCGVCDNCITRKKAGDTSLDAQILSRLTEPMEVKELVGKFRTDPAKVIAAIDALLSQGKIKMNDGKLNKNR